MRQLRWSWKETVTTAFESRERNTAWGLVPPLLSRYPTPPTIRYFGQSSTAFWAGCMLSTSRCSGRSLRAIAARNPDDATAIAQRLDQMHPSGGYLMFTQVVANLFACVFD